MAPQSVARGGPRSGDLAAAGMPEHAKVSKYTWGASSPLRGRIFPRKTLLRPARSHHSRRRLSRIPSRKATAAPAEIYSALP